VFERGCRPSEWEGFPGIVGTAKERLGARLFKDEAKKLRVILRKVVESDGFLGLNVKCVNDDFSQASLVKSVGG